MMLGYTFWYSFTVSNTSFKAEKFRKLFKDFAYLCALTGLYAVLNFYVISIFIYGQDPVAASRNLYHYAAENTWLLNYIESRLLLYVIALLILEINEKYSPGVFTDIFIGKYLKPREEKRIILFIDLKDSTPTAEKLPGSVSDQGRLIL